MSNDAAVRRGFAPDETETVMRIYWSAFRGKLGGVLGPDDRAIRFLSTIADPDHALVFRDADGVVLGVAGFKTPRGGFLGGAFRDLANVYGVFGASWRTIALSVLERPLEGDTLLMDGLAVTPQSRGMGVGTALLEGISGEARRRGLRRVRLDVIDRNPRAAALYVRSGFEPIDKQHLGPLRHVFGFRSATTMVRSI